MEKKEAWEMTKEEFKKQHFDFRKEAVTKIPFQPTKELKEWIETANKYLKKDFKLKMPDSWIKAYTILGEIYTDIEAKTPHKIPYKLQEKAAKSLGFGYKHAAAMGGNVIYFYNHRQIIEHALKEGKSIPVEVLKDYPDLVDIVS